MYMIAVSRARRTGASPEEPLTMQEYHGTEKSVLRPFFVKVSFGFSVMKATGNTNFSRDTM